MINPTPNQYNTDNYKQVNRPEEAQQSNQHEDPTHIKPCPECQGTGKLVYSNTGFENDCMYCNGFGVVDATSKQPDASDEWLDEVADRMKYGDAEVVEHAKAAIKAHIAGAEVAAETIAYNNVSILVDQLESQDGFLIDIDTFKLGLAALQYQQVERSKP